MTTESPAPLVPVCPTHPESPSVGTCSRCGRFLCGVCIHHVDPFLCVDCHARAGKPEASANKPKFKADFQQVVLWLVLPWYVYEFVRALIRPAGVLSKDIGWSEVIAGTRWTVLGVENVVATGILALLAVWIIPRYVRKKRDVPRLMQLLFVIAGVHVVLAAILRHALTPETAGKWWVIPLGAVFCWLLFRYFAKDPKVKATFVR